MPEFLGNHWAEPWFALLLLPPVLLWIRRLRRRGGGLAYPDPAQARDLPRSLRARLVSLPLHFQALGLALLALALARPQQRGRLPLRSEGIDIFLCLDLSSSMNERDMEKGKGKTRLQVVQEVAKRFIEGRPNDRIGLVGFALYPDLVCPPTLDHPALLRFLDGLRTKKPGSPEDRTGIGAGLSLCVEHLGKSGAESRVVILLTDGLENVEYVSPEKAAALAADEGVRVHAIGAGRGVFQPLFGLQELDFSRIEALARKTGGLFFRAKDREALAKIFARIDEMERREIEEPVYDAEDRFFPLALGALLSFCIAWLGAGFWPGGRP